MSTEVRYLPINNLIDLKNKCSAIVDLMDKIQMEQRELFWQYGIEYTELSYGFAFDIDKIDEIQKEVIMRPDDRLEYLLHSFDVKNNLP